MKSNFFQVPTLIVFRVDATLFFQSAYKLLLLNQNIECRLSGWLSVASMIISNWKSCEIAGAKINYELNGTFDTNHNRKQKDYNPLWSPWLSFDERKNEWSHREISPHQRTDFYPTTFFVFVRKKGPVTGDCFINRWKRKSVMDCNQGE